MFANMGEFLLILYSFLYHTRSVLSLSLYPAAVNSLASEGCVIY